jgi:hypothetical protein
MHLPLVPCVCGLAAILVVPAAAQHTLTARTFEPSLPAVAPAPEPPVPEWWRGGGPRIRRTDERIALAVRNGVERSSVVRALVDAIESSAVVVYASVDPGMVNGLSGRLTFMGIGGGYRYVRITLHPELNQELMIISLAHELQHVLEVIQHPEVTSEPALTGLYQRIGHSNRVSGRIGWETDAAQDVAAAVRRELRLGTAAMLARRETGRDDARR